jgi:prevent-host-death family protein
MGPDHRATDAPRVGPAKAYAEAAEVSGSGISYMPLTEVRAKFSDTIARANKGAWIMVVRNSKPIALIVPPEVAELLQRIGLVR